LALGLIVRLWPLKRLQSKQIFQFCSSKSSLPACTWKLDTSSLHKKEKLEQLELLDSIKKRIFQIIHGEILYGYKNHAEAPL